MANSILLPQDFINYDFIANDIWQQGESRTGQQGSLSIMLQSLV
ncbi:MAG: hypothetical protein ACK4M7_01930 [Burkholderiales bacterium]